MGKYSDPLIPKKRLKTAWEKNAKSYDALVGDQGSYYHKKVIFPKLLPLLNLRNNSTLLDFGCGQGVLSRNIPEHIPYFGLDIANTLLDQAIKRAPSTHFFKFQDVTHPFTLTKTDFTHITMILSLQNMTNLDTVIANAKTHLHPNGKLFIVLNHPAYRIPKHSEWHTTHNFKSRLVHRYMSPLKIEIDMNPGNPNSTTKTWSFHHPISAYMKALKAQHFVLEDLQEWTSNKVSVGKNAQRENIGREEIPMFMCWVAKPDR